MKRSAVVFALLIFLPISVHALKCEVDGYTVVYINGILTSETDAKRDRRALGQRFSENSNLRDVTFINAYNPSHLAGGGDVYKSVQQMLQKATPVVETDYDLETMLMQIHPQLTTQKVLIVGHSQGTFYANSMYRYLREHGVPWGSVAVYNVAAPAQYVEGAGRYLNSSNDKLLEKVRAWAASAGVAGPPRANITIPFPPGEEQEEYGGHHFGSSYLNMEPMRIVSDIENALSNLKASETRNGGCFTPPNNTLGYKVSRIAFAVGDPTAGALRSSIATAGSAVKTFANATGRVFTYFGKRSAQGGAAALAVTNTPVSQVLQEEENTASTPAGIQSEAISPEETFVPTTLTPELTSQQNAVPETTARPPAPRGPGPGGMSFIPQSSGGTVAPIPQEAEEEPELAHALAITDLAVVSPDNNAALSFSSVTFSGTSTAVAIITATHGTSTATTTANALGDWSLTLTLEEGTTTVSFVASTSTMATSSVATRTVEVDITESDTLTASVHECTYSLSESFCLLPTTSGTLAWNAVDGASYYRAVVNGFAGATTTATSTSVSLADKATTTLAVMAYDSSGSTSATSTAVEVFVHTQPLIVNEVAWAGTDASTADEWIELYNPTSYTIVLNDMALVAADSVPEIDLSGSVESGAYYLIERTDDSTVTGVSADLAVPFSGSGSGSGLSNDGEELRLVHRFGTNSATTLDQTPAVDTCNGWCEGDADGSVGFAFLHGTSTARISMERVFESTHGTLAASWQSNDTYTTSGADNDENTIYGTPGQANSKGWPGVGWSCDSDYTPITSGQMYVPPNSDCIYFTGFISDKTNRYGALYRGTVGSSMNETAHFMEKSRSELEAGDVASIEDPNPVPIDGTEFFIAIWEQRIGLAFDDDTALFTDYFEIGGESPHANFRIVPWIYGSDTQIWQEN